MFFGILTAATISGPGNWIPPALSAAVILVVTFFNNKNTRSKLSDERKYMKKENELLSGKLVGKTKEAVSGIEKAQIKFSDHVASVIADQRLNC